MAASVRLLGTPAVRQAGGWLELPTSKRSSILYYLAYHEGWVGRNELLYLFWPDMPEESARKNLRPTLTKLRRLPYSEELEVEASRLRWPVTSDIHAFRQALASSNWSAALNHYGGELLQGYQLGSAPEFESWLEIERAELQRLWREASLKAAEDLEITGRHAEARDILRRLYKTDPIDETLLRHYLQALYLNGERAKALEVFTTFTRTLQKEVALEPEPDTMCLVESIRAGTLHQGRVTAALGAAPKKQREGMPIQATTFIGRDSERAELAARLREPACRLLSLVGPGGIGKTRLAIEVASEQQGLFLDGAFFVPFETVNSVDFMVPALASALNFSFFGGQDPKVQLLAYLKDKEMLLVLDNLEHLLDGVGLVAELLASSAGVKVLATSRERLNLHAEWVFDVAGLSYPEFSSAFPRGEGQQDERQVYGAVQLFLQAAGQTRADFVMDNTSQKSVTRICQLVEGLPLALELAAGWLRLLTVEEVAAKLETGMGFLEASSRDMPERHRSVRAVFDYSWKLLVPREREALRRLSVFRGGFTLAAAQAVADVSLPLLLALVNKSFLRRSHTGRFSRHPLLRQFVEERALAHPEERFQIEARHGAYFTDFLHSRESTLHTPRERVAAKEIEADLENAEAAFLYAAMRGHEDWLDKALVRLCWFYFSRGWLERGLTQLRATERYVCDGGILQGRLLQWMGAFLFHGGRTQEGLVLLERSLSILERYDAKAALAFCLRGLGAAYGSLGTAHYERAFDAFGRALELYRELGDAEGTTMMLMVPAYQAKDPDESERLLAEGVRISKQAGLSRSLGMTLDTVAELCLYRKGDYHAARQVIEDALDRFAETGELLYRIPALGLYLRILISLGDFETAKGQAQSLLELSEERETSMAAQAKFEALGGLSRLAYLKDEPNEARALAKECLRLSEPMFDRGRTEVLALLAQLALSQGDLNEAEGWLEEAWTTLKAFAMRGSFALSASKLCCMSLMGELAILRNQEDAAKQPLREALTLAYAWGYAPASLEASVVTARLLSRRKQEEAARLLALAANHPATTPETQGKAQLVLAELAMTAEAFAATRAEVKGVALDPLAAAKTLLS